MIVLNESYQKQQLQNDSILHRHRFLAKFKLQTFRQKQNTQLSIATYLYEQHCFFCQKNVNTYQSAPYNDQAFLTKHNLVFIYNT